MKVLRFISKIFFTTMVVIMILAILLVVVSIFVTPATFGLEGLEINGVSLEAQGLASESFYNIGKIAIGLLAVPQEESVGEDTYIAVTEKLPTAVATESDEEVAITSLVKGRVYFAEEKEIQVNSAELSALLNMAIGSVDLSSFSDLSFLSDMDTKSIVFVVDQTYEKRITLSDAEEYFEMTAEELLETMQEYNCEFISMEPSVSGDIINLDVVCKLTLPSDIVSEVNDLGVVTISEEVYFSFTCDYTLENGELVLVESNETTVKLNSLSIDNTVKVLSSAMSIIAGEEVDGEEVLIVYNNTAGKLIATILNNLGEIQGVENGELLIVTRTE